MFKLCITKTIWVLTFWLLLHACGSAPDVIIPPTNTLHFPSFSTIHNGKYYVAGANADGKYGFGRLIGMSIAEIHKEITAGNHEPVPFATIESNVLVPSNTSQILIQDNLLVMASRGSGKIYAQPLNVDGTLRCNKSDETFESCDLSSSLDTNQSDPFSLVFINKILNKSYFALSFLGSDALQVYSYDHTINKKGALSLHKSFKITPLITENMHPDDMKGFSFFSRKLFHGATGLFILAEGKFQASETKKRPGKGVSYTPSFVLNIKTADLDKAKLEKADCTVLALTDFSIEATRDIYFDEGKSELYVMSSMPQMLSKIDWNTKKLLLSNPVCLGATSFSVDSVGKRMFVPCFSDNRVASFSLDNLALKNVTSELGRGPTYASFDALNNRLFVSFFLDGTVIILNADDLKYQGYLFNKAPKNRVGS